SRALRRIAPSEGVRAAAGRGAAASIQVPVIAPPSDSAVDAARVVFVWRSMEPRGPCRLTLMDAAGARLWSISTRDTWVTLPVEVRVAPGRTYLWYVDALAGDGRSSSSGVRSFSTTP